MNFVGRATGRTVLSRDVGVFLGLIAIGVLGRWWQPTWSFTPTAAVTLFAGYYFRNSMVAALVPLSVLAISDRFLSWHDNVGVAVTVYLAMTLPVLLGRWLRNRQPQEMSPANQCAAFGLCGFLPATFFFLTSNLAVWFFKSDYPHTVDGLAHCYLAALPFYRSMLAGDLWYGALLVAVVWAVQRSSRRRARAMANE